MQKQGWNLPLLMENHQTKINQVDPYSKFKLCSYVKVNFALLGKGMYINNKFNVIKGLIDKKYWLTNSWWMQKI